jgi:hypothetical protein
MEGMAYLMRELADRTLFHFSPFISYLVYYLNVLTIAPNLLVTGVDVSYIPRSNKHTLAITRQPIYSLLFINAIYGSCNSEPLDIALIRPKMTHKSLHIFRRGRFLYVSGVLGQEVSFRRCSRNI